MGQVAKLVNASVSYVWDPGFDPPPQQCLFFLFIPLFGPLQPQGQPPNLSKSYNFGKFLWKWENFQIWEIFARFANRRFFAVSFHPETQFGGWPWGCRGQKRGKKKKKRHCSCGGSNPGSLTYETDALINLATWPIIINMSFNAYFILQHGARGKKH